MTNSLYPVLTPHTIGKSTCFRHTGWDIFSSGYGLAETTLEIGGRQWAIWAVPDQDILIADVLTDSDLSAFPYGLLLWPAAVALAQSLAAPETSLRGLRVLELGCGPGLPGLIARWRGGEVTQTDYQMAPLELARENAERNRIEGIAHQIGDWRDFPHLSPFDLIIGSDILYERSLHSSLKPLLSTLLTPTGVLLLTDPLRPSAVEFLDELMREGWKVTMEAVEVHWLGETREIALFTALLF